MSDKPTTIEAQLEAIKLSYIESLSEKRMSIDEKWFALKESWLADTFDAVYLVIHGLAGSAETFGFPAITRQARQVVDKFKLLNSQQPPDDHTLLDEIDSEIQSLLVTMSEVTSTNEGGA